MARQETEVLNRWRLRYAKWGTLFRQQVGRFWAGQLHGDIWEEDGVRYGTLKNIQRTEMGVKGLSDYLGWHTMTITPEMVGRKIAVAAAIEGKTKDGRVSNEQQHFINSVKLAGGIAGIVWSEDTPPPKWE